MEKIISIISHLLVIPELGRQMQKASPYSNDLRPDLQGGFHSRYYKLGQKLLAGETMVLQKNQLMFYC